MLTVLVSSALVLTACTTGSSDGTADPSTSTPRSTPSSDAALSLPYPPTGVSVNREDGIVYRTVDGQQLTINACTPEHSSGPVPAVLIIHGGGFWRGSNTSVNMGNVCAALVEAGMAGFSVEYRLAPAHPFPAAVDDLQAAVEWLREPAQVTRFGIDPTRIGALGGSAGANLAMELGTLGTGDLTSGSRVAAVVSLSGPTDLTVAGLALGDIGQGRINIVRGYLGCTVIANCPQARDASPLYQVDPSDPPLFIAHSVNEPIPVAQAEVMIKAMRDASVTVESRLLPGRAHAFAYLDAPLWNDIVAFLRQSL